MDLRTLSFHPRRAREKFCVMGEKRGRPKKDIPRREKNIGFFVTNDQYAIIQGKAAEAMENLSGYMRQVAMAGEVRARWTAEERDMVRKLIGMSADLHRLAEGSRDAGALGASGAGAEFFTQLGDKLDIIIKHLCHDR